MKRKTIEDPACPICRLQPEIVEHILWSCPSARDVWALSVRKLQKASPLFHHFQDLVKGFLENLSKEELKVFAVTSWFIWKRRNEMVFKDTFQHPSKVSQLVAYLMDELQLLPQQGKTQSHPNLGQTRWEAPPQGKFKLNWDASISKATCKVGVGAVIRHCEGKVLATLRMQHDLFPDPLMAEAFAGLQASIFCKSLGYKDIIIEGDSLQVVSSLNSSTEVHTYTGQLISDTRSMQSSFSVWSARHTVRANNSVAHALSRDALSISGYTTSFDFIPICIKDLV
ncbi:uncharacterized protein LOC122304682 [Carya illinoinensis]|uniref:uncharacterized protein LOC122304682 n=1 Tax=Carya illinoinensis TaxID=32201 RepID=UPI001C71A87F|nr:uncharacterized protein LOC122304682 [Carya illinoinensis]